MATYSRLGTEFADLNPTQIARIIQQAAEQELPWPQLISWEMFTLPGTVWQEAQNPNLTFTAISESATIGNTDVSAAFDMSNRQITASLVGRDIYITKQALEAAQGDLQSQVTMTGKLAYFDKLDDDIMALYTEASAAAPDHEIGVDGTVLDYATYLAAFELLAAQAAFKPWSWVVGTAQISEVMSIPEFIEAQIFGRAVIEREIDVVTGNLGITPGGVGIYWSNNADESSGLHSIMFSKQALGVRMKEEFTVGIDASELNVGARSLKIGMSAWYGVGGLRDSATTNKFIVDIIS
jgi:hypothetical protein